MPNQSCSGVKTTVLPPSFDSDTPPDMSLFPKPGGGAAQPGSDVTGTEWVSSPCNPKARYRYTDQGRIEVEGEGVVKMPQWPEEIEDFRPLIEVAADANGISRALLAGLVATESGGKFGVMSPEGRLGLTQIPRELAKMVANPDFPQDKTPVDELHDSEIMQPAWNLMHGAKALAYFLATKELNLIAALAMYDHGEVLCDPNPACPATRWGVWTGCDYIDQVIGFTNLAVDVGYLGPRQVDLGADGIDEDKSADGGVGPYLLFGVLGAGVAFVATTLLSNKKGRR